MARLLEHLQCKLHNRISVRLSALISPSVHLSVCLSCQSNNQCQSVQLSVCRLIFLCLNLCVTVLSVCLSTCLSRILIRPGFDLAFIYDLRPFTFLNWISHDIFFFDPPTIPFQALPLTQPSPLDQRVWRLNGRCGDGFQKEPLQEKWRDQNCSTPYSSHQCLHFFALSSSLWIGETNSFIKAFFEILFKTFPNP